MDSRERYKKISTGLGGKLNGFLNEALTDADRLPGKRELKARLEEEFGDTGLNLEKLAETFVDLARRGQDRGTRWGLRGVIQETVIKVVTKLEEDDRLVDVEEHSDEEIAAAVEKADDRYADRAGGELDRKYDQERDEAREILRKAGRL